MRRLKWPGKKNAESASRLWSVPRSCRAATTSASRVWRVKVGPGLDDEVSRHWFLHVLHTYTFTYTLNDPTNKGSLV